MTEPSTYIFPKGVAKKMMVISPRTQMEASMLSMFFMMIGLVIMTIYICVYTDFSIAFKIMTGINAFFGVMFMGSFLVTSFQQYMNYMAAISAISEINAEIISPAKPENYVG